MTQEVKYRLVGDHSDVHCGCVAVIQALKAALPQEFVESNNDEFDVLIVNGEGSMHHDTNPCQNKMRQIHAAQQQGKMTYLVNSVWQQNSAKFNDVLSRLNGLTVREVDSRDDLILRHGIHAPVVPDLSLQAPITPSDIIDFDGRQVMTDFYSREFSAFVRITDGFIKRTAFIDMKRLEWSKLVNSLKTASLLVTGRHHAAMAACKARTPFVMLAGNTHKVEGFLRTAGVPIPVCQHPSEVAHAVAWAKDNRKVYDQLFDWVERLPAWTLDFDLQNSTIVGHSSIS